jgi:hypothetical protein
MLSWPRALWLMGWPCDVVVSCDWDEGCDWGGTSAHAGLFGDLGAAVGSCFCLMKRGC